MCTSCIFVAINKCARVIFCFLRLAIQRRGYTLAHGLFLIHNIRPVYPYNCMRKYSIGGLVYIIIFTPGLHI